MNKSKAIKIAIAFKRGAAFIRGMRQLAQDADVPEGARWITIGAAEGDDGKRHGGRPVLIDKESGTILKGLSKDVQGKTLNEAFSELRNTHYTKGDNAKKYAEKMANGIAEYKRSAKEGADKLRKTISKLKGLRSAAKANNKSWDLNRLIKIYEKQANEWENSDIDKKISTGAEIMAKEHGITDPSVKERILNYETEELNHSIQNLNKQADKFLAKMQEIKKPTRTIYDPTANNGKGADIVEEVKPGESVKLDAKGVALIQEMRGIKSEEYKPIAERIGGIVRRLNPDDEYTSKAINALYDTYNTMKNTDSDKLSGNKATRESDIKYWTATGENAGIITELERYARDPNDYKNKAIRIENENKKLIQELDKAIADIQTGTMDRQRKRLLNNLRFAEGLAYQVERNRNDSRMYAKAPFRSSDKESFIHPTGLKLSTVEEQHKWANELLEKSRNLRK